MEKEKTLITAKRGIFNKYTITFFSLAVITLIACFVVAYIYEGEIMWAFEGIAYGYYWFFIFAVLFVILGFVPGKDSENRSTLVVTDKRIIGTTMFGKRVDLPITQVSATGTGVFSRVSVATSSGNINFYGIANQQEVFECISKLLIELQNETKNPSLQSNQAPSQSHADELKKYKDLLDSGVITQEEFDEKKKQLLNL